MSSVTIGPGRHAPARFASLIGAALLALAPAGSRAQTAPPPAPSAVPVPGELEINKLIWSTMAAVDHANQAGNYSVLRDLAAPGFQLNNDSARLAAVFQSLRASRIDLSNSLLLAPTLTATPRVLQPGVIQFQGYFGLRPTAIGFDLVYQWAGGKWRLFGVSINPVSITNMQPQAAPPPQARPPKRN